MKRLYIITAVILATPMGIGAMDVAVKDRLDDLRDQAVQAYNGGAHGVAFESFLANMRQSDLTALCRRISAPVLAKAAHIEQQQTDASLDDLNETLALLRVLYHGEKQFQYMAARSRLEAIKNKKVALLKAAAGPTAEELGRNLRLEEQRLAEEARLDGLKDQVVQAYNGGAYGSAFESFLENMKHDDLRALCRRISAPVLAKVSHLELQQTDASLDDLNETLALLRVLYHDKKESQYMAAISRLEAIKNKKVAILKAAAGPTAEELEKQRLAKELAQTKEAEKLAKYNALKQQLFDTWRITGREKRDAVSRAVTNAFAERGRSGTLIVTPGPIWEFLNWIMPEAFEKAETILANPDAATVDQIRDALVLLAAFYKQSYKQDVTANSLYVRLEQLHWERTHSLI